MPMKAHSSLLPLLAAAALLPSCSTQNLPDGKTTPWDISEPVDAVPVPTYTCTSTRAIGKHEQRLNALEREEREALARALVRSQDWGQTQEQHNALAEKLWLGKESFLQLEKALLRAIRLPRGASPELRRAMTGALEEDENLRDWGLILEFVPLVTQDHLTQHPKDTRAWDFLHFLCRLSDGEADYSTSITRAVLNSKLDRHEEGRQFLYGSQE